MAYFRLLFFVRYNISDIVDCRFKLTLRFFIENRKAVDFKIIFPRCNLVTALIGDFLLIFLPSCLAVCGHHLSPTVAIVFSLLSSVPNLSMSHYFVYFPHLLL